MLVQRVFQDFVEGVRASSDTSSLLSATSAAFAAFDLKAFAYVVFSSASDNIDQAISTYPDRWLDLYASRKYSSVDPVVRHMRTLDAPLEWHRDAMLTDAAPCERELFEDAAAFGIRCGFVIPLRGIGKVAGAAFVADEPHAKFQRCIAANKRTLLLMAVLVHLQAARLLTAPDVSGVRLTPRELDCLRWAAHGKSASDIGCILGITRRTVSFHIENAKAKLGVRTTCQAVAKLAAGNAFVQPG